MGLVSNGPENDLENMGFEYQSDGNKDGVHFSRSTSEESFHEACASIVTPYLNLTRKVYIGLSGGSNKLLYKYLSDQFPNNFSNVELLEIDERYVPGDHEHSNRKLIHEYLIENVDEISGFSYFQTELPTTEEVVAEYSQKLNGISLDIACLGIGPDGHTASLFPGVDALHEEEQLAVHTQTEQFDVLDRFSVTFPVIMKTKTLLVYLRGEGKKEIWEQLQNPQKSIEEFPAIKLLEHSDIHIMWGDF
ncbi:6-phosphogluconolactonase [Candidatus Dojkabacteria bacterium]|uniref:6-phosphogluconolactonase n=1 Tax=Candidatus Dojkabacteria bacterium TaxID=2099670 RepID=A0A955L7K9_9BACT|nr:6-phosphogluconolactonase [Candidatus Dojkabacteria bacterium]